MNIVNVENLNTKFIMNQDFLPAEFKVPSGFQGMDTKRVIKTESYLESIVEIIDARNIDDTSFQLDAVTSKNWLYNIQTSKAIHLYKIFIFSDFAGHQILNTIKNSQFNDVISKRFLSCYIVDSEKRKSYKMFEPFIKSQQIDKILEDALGSQAKHDTRI